VAAVLEACNSRDLVDEAYTFELDSEVFEEAFFHGEFESTASKRRQKPFDICFILCHDWAVIRIASNKDVGAIEQALIVLALSEANSQKAIAEVFEPQTGRHRQAVQTLVKPEASLWPFRGAEAMGKMDPDWILQLGLDKGRIDQTSRSAESESKHEQDPYH
jgi:hypothetical protein